MATDQFTATITCPACHQPIAIPARAWHTGHGQAEVTLDTSAARAHVATHAKGQTMTEPSDHREVLCDWLRANGINPDDVPVDADMTITTADNGARWLWCEVYARDATGHAVVNVQGDAATRTTVTAPLTTEPPDWWQPHVKPSREQLLEALGAVRQIHRPVEHCGKTICGHCSAWDDGIRDSTDNAPVTYPCDTIKALRHLPSVQVPLGIKAATAKEA